MKKGWKIMMILSVGLLVGLQVVEIRANVLRELEKEYGDMEPVLVGTYQFDDQEVEIYYDCLKMESYSAKVDGKSPKADLIINKDKSKRLYIAYDDERFKEDGELIEPAMEMIHENQMIMIYELHSGKEITRNFYPDEYTVLVYEGTSIYEWLQKMFDFEKLENEIKNWEKTKDQVNISDKNRCLTISSNWHKYTFTGGFGDPIEKVDFYLLKEEDGSGYVEIVDSERTLYKLTDKQVQMFEEWVYNSIE